MTAFQSPNIHLKTGSRNFFQNSHQLSMHPGSPRTSGQENAFFLIVQVQHPAAAADGQVDGIRAFHTGLLVNRDYHLQTGMGNAVRIKKGKRAGYRDAIVSAQTGSFRIQPVSIHLQIQALPGHVLRTVRVLYCNHVHMALQDHGFLILIARSCFLYYNDIFHLVLQADKASAFREFLQIIADRFHISGAARNAADLFKIVKYFCGLQPIQFSHNLFSPSFRPFSVCTAKRKRNRICHIQSILLYFFRFYNGIVRCSCHSKTFCIEKRPVNKAFTGLLPPRVGLEPTTTRLTAECSTIELSRNIHLQVSQHFSL